MTTRAGTVGIIYLPIPYVYSPTIFRPKFWKESMMNLVISGQLASFYIYCFQGSRHFTAILIPKYWIR